MQAQTRKIIMMSLVMGLGLTSCGKQDYSIASYRAEMNYHDGFKIMQLTDVHLAIESDLLEVESLITADVSESNPDLIVFTGDTFMEAGKPQVDSFFAFIDAFNVPFAFTYGNHDFQGNYDQYYISRQLKKCKNAIYLDYSDDGLTGLANYYIDLKQGTTTLFRLFILDSNSYYFNGAYYSYDIIHEDQIKHMENIAAEEGIVPSLAFYHIPVYEFDDANKAYEAGDSSVIGTGDNEEKVSYGYKRTDAFDRMKNIGVIGHFVGHDHINDTTLLYKGAVLSYGLKSSQEIYNDDKKIGYKLITLTYKSGYEADDLYSSVVRFHREVS